MNLDVVMNVDVVLIPGLTAEFADPIKTPKEIHMTNEELYLAVALNGWKGNIERADKMFSGLSDQEVLKEIAPGKNRLIYIWGHLTAIHDAMLPLLGVGERLHPEFDVAFVSNPDKSQAAIPSHEHVRQAWETVNGELSKGFEKMSQPDWLQRHAAR